MDEVALEHRLQSCVYAPVLTMRHFAQEALDKLDLVLAGPGLEFVHELVALVLLLVATVAELRVWRRNVHCGW